MYNVINITSKKIKTKQTKKNVPHVKSMSTTQSHDIWRWKSKSWLWTGATM